MTTQAATTIVPPIQPEPLTPVTVPAVDQLPKPNPKEVLLAAIPDVQLQSLLKVLAAACAASYSGESSPELKLVAKQSASAAHRAALALSSEVVPILVKVIAGESVDQDALIESIKELRLGIRYDIKTDRSISHDVLDMFKATTAYLVNYGEPALKKVRQLAPQLGEPAITKNFISETKSQSDFTKPISVIVKKLTGKPGVALSQEQVLQLKEKAPELHKEYLRLRKGFHSTWTDAVRNFVFESKKPTVPYAAVLKMLKDNKMEHTLPPDFVGRIDANGKLYTVTDKLINGVPGPGFGVVMNPNYDAKTDNGAVFTTVNPEGKISQYVYTVDYRKKANKQKFEKVAQLDKIIDDVHTKIVKSMRLMNDTPQCVAATVLEILYSFTARIGSAGNKADGKDTFGISTLRVNQTKFGPGQVLINYLGKGGVRHKHLIVASEGPEAKLMYLNLKRLVAGKEPKDPVFTAVRNGRTVLCDQGMVNNWFRKFGAPAGVTVHKLRHVQGNKAFRQLLEENNDKIFGRKKPLTQAEADKMLLALATKVGAMLGHVRGVGKQEKATGATAIANYIDPGLMINYYERLNLRIPKFLTKVTK
jgi:hypothetical protein